MSLLLYLDTMHTRLGQAPLLRSHASEHRRTVDADRFCSTELMIDPAARLLDLCLPPEYSGIGAPQSSRTGRT